MAEFWSRADTAWSEPEKCWNWLGALTPQGYGVIERSGRVILAHRHAWTLAHPGDPLRRGDHVCHRCDNRRCIRPSHLFLGTAADNHDDATDKGRIPNHLRATAEEQRDALREWTP